MGKGLSLRNRHCGLVKVRMHVKAAKPLTKRVALCADLGRISCCCERCPWFAASSEMIIYEASPNCVFIISKEFALSANVVNMARTRP